MFRDSAYKGNKCIYDFQYNKICGIVRWFKYKDSFVLQV